MKKVIKKSDTNTTHTKSTDKSTSTRDTYIWNLTMLFQGDDDPKLETKLKVAKKNTLEFAKKWKSRTDYLEIPEVLKVALDEYEQLLAQGGIDGKVGFYWMLRSSQDEDDPIIKANNNKVHEKVLLVYNEIEFFELRIGKIPRDVQLIMLKSDLLQEYKHFLERCFETVRFQLSEDEEKIINIKSKTSHGNWVDMTSRFLMKETAVLSDEKGQVKRRTFSEIQNLINAKDKEVRDAAAKAFHRINRKHSDVAEAEINSILEDHKMEYQLRGYSRPDEPRHVSDDISTKAVDSLIIAVSNSYDISRQYYELKAKLLGVDQLKYHERNISYGRIETEYSFDEARNLVLNKFHEIDEEFGIIMKSLLKEGSYDVFPRKGKTSGAFCAGSSKSIPVYILLNHTNRLKDVLTIAHETGHAINDVLMKKKQNELNIGTPKCIAEVASTFFEDSVLEKLIQEADDELRLTLLVEQMDSDISSVFRQIAAYRFEQDLHSTFAREGYVTKEIIGELFHRHMGDYMGHAVELSPGSENWWVYWSHFRSFFYVYSYASGVLISKNLRKLAAEGPQGVEKVKNILAAGTSASPKEIFNNVGIDIENPDVWKTSLDEIEKSLQETNLLAKKLGKI